MGTAVPSLRAHAQLLLLLCALFVSPAGAANGCDPKKAIDCNFKYAVCVHGEWFKMTDTRGNWNFDTDPNSESYGYPALTEGWTTTLQGCADTWRSCVLKSGTRDLEHYTTVKGGEKVNYGGSGECVMSMPEVGTINNDVSRELGPPKWNYPSR